MRVKTIFVLLRINQWYKNLVIYLALIFGNLFFNYKLFLLTTIGFFSLCFISSVNYIVNDIIDRKKDVGHPEKKNRPIASGKINIFTASIIALFLLVFGFYIAYSLSMYFFLSVLALFILTSMYSFSLKNILFLDILLVATNFVIRAISGTFVINIGISPWLILCPFFLSLFLIVGKRKADIDMLKSNAYNHKTVLKFYTKEVTDALLIIFTTLLIISYSLYAFLSEHEHLLFTLPFAIFLVLRYLHLIYSGSEIARKPNKFYKDKALILGGLIWFLVTLFLLYI